MISVLEVTLRNKLDCAATGHFGRQDWMPLVIRHAGDRQWVEMTNRDPALALTHFRKTASQHNKKTVVVAGVSTKLAAWKSPAEEKYEQLQRSMDKKGIPPLASNFIANAMLGMWVDMFHSSFAGPSATSLWMACTNAALPGLGTTTLETIERDLRAILGFRNRNFHHEPVWRDGPAMTPLKVEVHLGALIQRIERVIGALSPDMLLTVRKAGFIDRLKWLVSIDAINAFSTCDAPAAHDGDRLAESVADILASSAAAALPPAVLAPHRAVSVTHHGRPAAIIVGLT